MFSIGLFTSHIPYILFIVAYLVFFFNGSFLKKKELSETTDVKEIQFKQSKENTNQKSVYYWDYQKQLASKCKNAKNTFFIVKQLKIYFSSYLDPVVNPKVFFILFKRPPPFLF